MKLSKIVRRLTAGLVTLVFAAGLGLAANYNLFTDPSGSNPMPENPPNLGTLNTMINNLNQLIGVNQANNTAVGLGLRPGGLIYTTVATVGGAANVAEQTLASYTLPANALDRAGRTIRVKVNYETLAGSSHNIRPRLYFGSTNTPGMDWGASPNVNNATMTGEMIIVEGQTANQQIIYGSMQSGALTQPGPAASTSATYFGGLQTNTTSSAITIWAACTQGSATANDCILNNMTVEYLN